MIINTLYFYNRIKWAPIQINQIWESVITKRTFMEDSQNMSKFTFTYQSRSSHVRNYGQLFKLSKCVWSETDEFSSGQFFCVNKAKTL